MIGDRDVKCFDREGDDTSPAFAAMVHGKDVLASNEITVVR